MSADLAYAKSCPDGLKMQQYRQQREAIKSRIRSLRGYPGKKEFLDARSRLSHLNAKFPYIFLDQEIKNFPLIGDVACLFSAMRTATQQNLNYQPRTDGKFNLFHDGQKIREGLSTADLLNIAKSLR